MPPLALLVPVALPVLASVVSALSGRFGGGLGRIPAAAGAWAAAVALIALWLPVRETEELSLGQLGFTALDLRIDAVGLVFALIVVVPAAALLSLQPRSWRESTIASLGVASAVLALEAAGVVLTAFAGCTAATLAVIQLDVEDPRSPRPSWAMLLAAWLALAWAGVLLQAQSGTAIYAAVPVSAMTIPVFGLMAFAAVFAAGLFPWRGWATQLWARPSLRAAGLAVATMQPLGVYLLVRAYEMGNGHFPQRTLNILLAAWGVIVAVGAASRAQAAVTRRQHMAEVLPVLAGFALMAISVGSALGMVASLSLLTASAVLAICLPLIPDRGGPASLLVAAAGAAVPPGLAFGALLLALDAAFEAGGPIGVIGLGGVATWLLWAASAARAVSLPAGRGRPASETSSVVAGALAGLLVAAGPALGIASFLGTATAADVMSVPADAGAGGVTAIITESTVLPAVALLGPALVIAAIALIAARPMKGPSRTEARPPLFELRGAPALARWRDSIRRTGVPAQYRSLFKGRALEMAAAGGTPILWLASLIALGVAVTR